MTGNSAGRPPEDGERTSLVATPERSGDDSSTWDLLTRALQNVDRWVLRALCRAVATPLSPRESIEGTCEPHPNHPKVPSFDGAVVDEVLLGQAIRRFEVAEKRHEAIKEKAKAILTIAVFVASFITFAAGFSRPGPLLIVPAAFVLVTTRLFLEIFRLSWSAFPSMDSELVEAEPGERRRLLADGYVRAASFGDLRTDYMATILIASRRAAGLALASVVVVIVAYAVRAQQPTTGDVIRALRNDRELLGLLRGPSGPSGPAGSRGPQGMRGDRGPKGEDRVIQPLDSPLPPDAAAPGAATSSAP